VKLTRRYRFCASHRLSSPALTSDENRQLYGKCNNPYGHGHDYIVDITVEGEPDANGLIARREALDELVQDRVLARLDHRNLNVDVPELVSVVPTTENLGTAIWASLEEGWKLPARLRKIRIAETDRNIFELEASELEPRS
jgi:6-pyruvoyltetrahydropterin/6-carboxytetrahydropterin synthase